MCEIQYGNFFTYHIAYNIRNLRKVNGNGPMIVKF